ncbi:putative fimbrial protein precursor (Pilin) [Legionella birminghamensis]|uniref:Pilin n=1 Tax=Legionella birminghamensis TaxID=28083 RepID=A0A378JV99_9GAMM|nr:type IV conjugative transfer system pilin TraA [Legionella birminghamensis]KTC69809.1 putative fimbrial protein precursor (Pilin) [Legionella birminghamensis]STX60919.1 putative fimbrial protein precursor (Pilin) [Legionella birminghamensis]
MKKKHFMTINARVREKSIQLHEFLKWSMPVLVFSWLLIVCFTSIGHAEAGQNYLSGMKSDVSATFGKNSDLPGYLYGAETLVAGVTWMNKKSPWIFVGLPLLMIFTHWGLSYVS